MKHLEEFFLLFLTKFAKFATCKLKNCITGGSPVTKKANTHCENP